MTKHEKKVISSRFRRFAVALASIAIASTAAVAPVPASAAEQSATVCRWYVVRRGDQLGELAIRYRTDVLALRRANGLRTTRIFIGQRLCIPTVVVARPPSPSPSTPSSGGPWYGEYWNNTGQSGLPAVVRNDAAINFNWGFGSPEPSRIFADNFSARWSRAISFEGGIYRFGVNADDGFRLYVDGNLVMDFIGFEGNQSRAVDVSVPPGSRSVRLDYVERGGQSVVKFNYFRVSGGTTSAPQNLSYRAEYFNNNALAGSPQYVATVKELNFNWGAGSPAASIARDNWTARFTQYRSFVGGAYRVVAQVDDGVRVWVDDRLVINEWREQSYRTFVGDVDIAAGEHTIRVEYLEVTNQAALRVYLEKR